MATNMVYDPSQQKWIPDTSNSSGNVVTQPSKPSNSGSSSKPSSSSSSGTSSYPKAVSSVSKTQTDSEGLANKEQALLEYNTLEGDISLKASVGVLKIKENTTIEIDGIGNYLSGQYYVSGVTYSLDSSSGFSMSCTVVKTGFGPSLKASSDNNSTGSDNNQLEVKDSSTYTSGDKIQIVGDAVYTNASEGVKVPNWVKQQTLTVSQISSDGTKALLQPINSWVYTKYLQKV